MVEPLRMNVPQVAPEAYRHLLELEQAIASKIDRKLLHIIKLRASQINGCAYCIGMHTQEALRDGDTPERLLLLDAWHESSAFDDKERAALEWVEEITFISEGHAHKEAFDALRPHFSEEEIVWLTLASALINAWNRISIASRAQFTTHHATGEQKVAEPA
jgi:AhpD family alkylhydroperoxidase